MKKPSIVILLFLIILGGISANTVLAYWDTNTISERENRRLAPEPELTKESWLSGEFARGTEEFLGDHAYRRNQLLDLSERFTACLGKDMEVRVVSQAVDMGQGQPEQAEGDDSEGSQATEAREEEKEERIILEDRVLSSYTSNPRARNRYRNVVNAFMDMFPDTISKANLIIPSRIAFEPDYQDFTDDQRKDIQAVYEGLDASVHTVDIWEELAAGDVNELYFRTDHHWSADGAYIGVKGYLEEIGRTCYPKDRYQRRTGESFLGYLYAQTGQESLRNHKDELAYYVHPDGISREIRFIKREDGSTPEVSVEDVVLDASRQGYYTFVGESFAYSIIDGKLQDGSCLLLVGDSYCNAMAPWFSDNFEKVIILDPRDWLTGKDGLMNLYEQEQVTHILMADYTSVIGNYWFTSQIEKMTK